MAKEYGWLPFISDGLEWAEIIGFLKAIISRNERKEKEKLLEYAMLLQIVHTSKPQELYEELSKALSGKEFTDEMGDMEKLKAFKGKPKYSVGGRKYGDG